MSEIEKKDEKKVENPPTSQQNKDINLNFNFKNMSAIPESKDDEKVKDEIQHRVVEHVIKFDEKKDTTNASTQENPTSNTVPAKKESPPIGEDVSSLKKQLEDIGKAKKDTEDELTKLRQESGANKDLLQQRESQLQALALKEFEDKKSLLVGKIRQSLGDDKANEASEKIKTGKDLDGITMWTDYIENAIKVGKGEFKSEEKKVSTPAGKVNASKPTTGDDEYAGFTTEQMVNDIYDNLEEQKYLQTMGMPYDAKKLAKYESMENKLLKALVDGEKNRNKITPMRVMQCRSCGQILTGGETTCPNVNCGKPIYHKTSGGI